MLRGVVLAMLAIGAVALVRIAARPRPASPPAVYTSAGRIDVRRCADCHPDIYDRFQKAPHRRTLRPAADEELRALFAGGTAEAAGDVFRFVERDGSLFLASEKFPAELPVDWFFGSGSHAITPVSVMTNPQGETEVSQLNISWYPQHGLGLTPGSETEYPSLGVQQNHAESLHCFGCHSSYLPVENGRIDFDNLDAGVTCTRCHAGAAEHMDAEGGIPTRVAWKSLTPRESINRCGECHRRADEFTPDELTHDNKLLIRFAPVGLALSPCFQAQHTLPGAKRLDCITCHDPHSPASSDPAFYAQRCLKCHQPKTPSHKSCPVRPTGTDCQTCHMPKVETTEHLEFTDHWIRIRRPESP